MIKLELQKFKANENGLLIQSEEGDIQPYRTLTNTITKQTFPVSELVAYRDRTGNAYVIPAVNISDFIKNGEIIRDFTPATHMDNWRLNNGYQDQFNTPNTTILTHSFDVTEADPQYVRALKRFINVMSFTVDTSTRSWLKSIFKDIDDGTISFKKAVGFMKHFGAEAELVIKMPARDGTGTTLEIR